MPGSSPCLPHSTWHRAGSEVFMPHQAPPNTLLGIQSPAPASVSSPQTESTTAPGGVGAGTPTLLGRGSKLGDTGGREEPEAGPGST